MIALPEGIERCPKCTHTVNRLSVTTGCSECNHTGHKIHFRMVGELKGGHVHTRLWVGPYSNCGSLSGNIILREQEWKELDILTKDNPLWHMNMLKL